MFEVNTFTYINLLWEEWIDKGHHFVHDKSRLKDSDRFFNQAINAKIMSKSQLGTDYMWDKVTRLMTTQISKEEMISLPYCYGETCVYLLHKKWLIIF